MTSFPFAETSPKLLGLFSSRLVVVDSESVALRVLGSSARLVRGGGRPRTRGTRSGARRRRDPLVAHGAEEAPFLEPRGFEYSNNGELEARRKTSDEAGVFWIKLYTSLFIKENSLQILAAKSASRKMDESLSPHVSQGKRKRRPTTPTMHENQGNTSINREGPVIS
jgi:hypothetical protein